MQQCMTIMVGSGLKHRSVGCQITDYALTHGMLQSGYRLADIIFVSSRSVTPAQIGDTFHVVVVFQA